MAFCGMRLRYSILHCIFTYCGSQFGHFDRVAYAVDDRLPLCCLFILDNSPAYLSGSAVAGGIALISCLGQAGALIAPLVIGKITRLPR